MNLNVSLEGIDSIKNLIADLERRTGNLEPAMKSIGEHIVAVAKLSFRNCESPAGDGWKTSARAERDKSANGKAMTLDDTGRLKNSLDYKANRDSVRAGTIKAGSNVKYAAIHQFGFDGSVPVKAHQRMVTHAFRRELKFPVWADIGAFTRNMHMPARPYMPMTMDEIGEQDIETIILNKLRKQEAKEPDARIPAIRRLSH